MFLPVYKRSLIVKSMFILITRIGYTCLFMYKYRDKMEENLKTERKKLQFFVLLCVNHKENKQNGEHRK